MIQNFKIDHGLEIGTGLSGPTSGIILDGVLGTISLDTAYFNVLEISTINATTTNSDLVGNVSGDVTSLGLSVFADLETTNAQVNTYAWINDLEAITLTVDGAAELQDVLDVYGATTIHNTLDVTDSFYINTDKFTVNASNGNTHIEGMLEVFDNTTINGLLIVSGGQQITGLLDVSSTFKVNTNKFTVNHTNGNTLVAGTLDVGSTAAITGNTTITGDLAVNGGDLTTTSTTFNLLNTNATTINLGSAASAISIGSSAHTGTTTIQHDLYVYGNITFGGEANTLSATNLSVQDALIYLANDNAANIVDIGIIGAYKPASTHLHSGFVRDASDGVWKLFSNVTPEPTSNTVDFTSATYDTLKIGTLTATGAVNVTGALTAASKSFLIPHPTKPNMQLQYGSLEGPENGVYVRGKLVDDDVIDLPDYWVGLVDESTITVNLTSIGSHQNIYVEKIVDNKVFIGTDKPFVNCFYTVFAERKDIDKLKVEF